MIRAWAITGVLVLLPAVAAAQQPCTGDARHVVNELYSHILERSADRGSDQWVRQLRSGQASVRDVVRQIVVSSEHTQRFAPIGSPEEREKAVRNLYRHVLGRDADQNGLRAHTQGLETSGVQAVVDNMLNSAEYRERFGDNGIPGTSGLRFCGGQQGAAGGDDDARFRSMDSDNDGRITRGEWRGDRQSFNVSDQNRDGVLSGTEIRTAARRLAAEDGSVSRDNANGFESWTRENFETIDHNGDNRITEAEWTYGYDTFRQADRNGDGVLTRPEFLANDANDNRSESFESLDANNDGRVTRSEWRGSVDAFEWLDRNDDNVLSRREIAGRRNQ